MLNTVQMWSLLDVVQACSIGVCFVDSPTMVKNLAGSDRAKVDHHLVCFGLACSNKAGLSLVGH